MANLSFPGRPAGPLHPRRGVTAGLAGWLLGCLLGWHATAAEQPGATPPAAGYRLEQLAAQLATAPAEQRVELARIVLDEMTAAYASEAAHARGDMRRGSGAGDLRRWAAAVDALGGQLAALAQTLTETTPVQAKVNRDNSVTLLVDGQPVEVNSPRIADQTGLERRIIERFCSRHACADFDAQSALEQAAADGAGRLPHWSFGAETGAVCSTDDGLQFRFQNTDDLRRKREACSRVVAELDTLVAEISQYRAAGGIPDWDTLAIRTLPGGDRQRVAISVAGDYVEAYLPALAAAPDLLALLRPWLISKVNALEPQPLAIDADRLLPATGFLGQ